MHDQIINLIISWAQALGPLRALVRALLRAWARALKGPLGPPRALRTGPFQALPWAPKATRWWTRARGGGGYKSNKIPSHNNLGH